MSQLNLDNIPTDEHENVMTSFWMMMRELETVADNENDPILKTWVAQWSAQWNRLTGDSHKPRWLK